MKRLGWECGGVIVRRIGVHNFLSEVLVLRETLVSVKILNS